jgi:hypothetical protein
MASTHQIAHRTAPDARIVYVDIDPLVSTYANAPRQARQGLATKSTSLVSTVPAFRPGAAWYFQYRFVCAMT